MRLQGKEYTSFSFSGSRLQIGIKVKFSTPWNPRSNLAESGVRSILKFLRVFCENQPKVWPKWLQMAVRSHNRAYHISVSDTPYFLHFGCDPLLNPGLPQDTTEHQDKADRVIQAQLCQELTTKYLKEYHKKWDNLQKPNYQTSFALGNLVFIKDQFVKDRAHKLRYRFKGPFRVIQIFGNSIVAKSLATNKEYKVSLRNAKIYHNENITQTESANAHIPFPSGEGDLEEGEEESK